MNKEKYQKTALHVANHIQPVLNTMVGLGTVASAIAIGHAKEKDDSVSKTGAIYTTAITGSAALLAMICYMERHDLLNYKKSLLEIKKLNNKVSNGYQEVKDTYKDLYIDRHYTRIK